MLICKGGNLVGIRHWIRVFLETSWPKTFYFNIRYFGPAGLSLPVIVARNMRLKKTGGRVILGKNRCGRIFLGRNDCRHIQGRGVWDNEGTVVFQDKCFLGNGTKLSVLKDGVLTLEKDTYITGNARIICERAVTIGSGTIISWDTTLMDTDLHSIWAAGSPKRINEARPIVVASGCWIGMGAVLLKGTRLKKGTIVAAKSVLSKEIPEEGCIVGGDNHILKKSVFWTP